MKIASENELRIFIRKKLMNEVYIKDILKNNENPEKITPDELVRYIRNEITRFADELEELAIDNLYPFLDMRLKLVMTDIKQDIKDNNVNPLGGPEHDYNFIMKRTEGT